MRRYEIDQLRVYAFLILIVYHVGIFFSPWYYHIKNNVELPPLSLFISILFYISCVRLPLLFFISGVGTKFSISKRSTGGFIKERFIRLFIPLLFGVLIIVPPQIYFERLIDGVNYSSFFDFYFHDAFTKGFYRNGGNIAWNHLWFILYLLIFSVIFALIKPILDRLFEYFDKHILSKGNRAWLLLPAVCIPTFLFEYFLHPIFPSSHYLVKDWYSLFDFLWIFICGYFFARYMDKTWPLMAKIKYIALILGAAIVVFYGFLLAESDSGRFVVTEKTHIFMQSFSRTISMWCLLFSIFGFGITYLNKNTKWLSYANEAVYPFYIIHQTILIAIGFYIRDLSWSIPVKFIVMLVGTFSGSWILYEFVIRRINILRVLFGMRPLPCQTQKKQ